MKQSTIFMTILRLTFSIFVVVCMISCSNDYFFEFDDDDSYYNHLLEKESLVEIKPSTYDFSEYLDVEHLSFAKMTDEELVILEKAEGRLTFSVVDGCCFIHEKKASDINISDKLFEYIKKCYDNNNELMWKINSKNIKRTKGGDPEIVITHDCLAHAISYMCSISYSSVDSWLSSTFGSYYSNNGVPYNVILPVIQHFRSSATDHVTYPSGGIGNNHSLHDGVLILNSNGNEYHAVNAQQYHEPGIFNNQHIVRYYQVYNSSVAYESSIIISSNSIPSTDIYGTRVINALIY